MIRVLSGRLTRLLAGGMLALFALTAAEVSAEELRMYAAAGVLSPLKELTAAYEKSSGHRVAIVFDTAGATEKRFLGDPQATFLITGRERIESAAKAGKLKGGILQDVGATIGGFAVPPGKPKPDISTPEKLKAALLAAPRIVFSDPERGATIGRHFMKVIEALGIKEAVLKKAVIARDGVETMRIVLAGEADLGVTQTAEVVQANSEALVGPFPGEYDLATMYSLWYRADAPPAALEFAKLVTGPLSREKMRKYGLRPPSE